VVGREMNSQNLVNMLVTNVSRCNSSNAKTLGLKHLQFPDMVMSILPPDEARIFHHRTYELLIEKTIPDGQTTSPLQEISNSPSLCAAFFLT
jgi:hypothetical protein